MAKPKQLPNGKWHIRLFIGKEDGKDKFKYFTHADKRQVEYLAAAYKVGVKKDAPDMLLKEAYQRYIDSKSNVLSPATVREYLRSMKDDLPGLMNKKLRDLTRENIQIEFNQEALSHSTKSLKNMRGLLTAVLSVYMPDFRVKVTLPQPTKQEIYVPSDDDIKALIAAVTGTEFELVILLAAFGSLRRSEICALTADDINGNVVTINKAKVKDRHGKWVVKKTKNISSTRKVEMPQFVIDKTKGIEGDIIKITNPDSTSKKFIDLRNALGLTTMRLHDLRHYQASILHALGVPDKYIMERGGWKTETTLNKVYKHAMDKKKQEVTKMANDYFANLATDMKTDTNV